MQDLQRKAVIIENDSQWKRFKILMKKNDIEMHYPQINTEDTFYAMIYKTAMGYYIIPNRTLQGTASSVISLNFELITLKQMIKLFHLNEKEKQVV